MKQRKYVAYIIMEKQSGMNKFPNSLHMFREH